MNVEPLPPGARFFQEQMLGRAEDLLPSVLGPGA